MRRGTGQRLQLPVRASEMLEPLLEDEELLAGILGDVRRGAAELHHDAHRLHARLLVSSIRQDVRRRDMPLKFSKDFRHTAQICEIKLLQPSPADPGRIKVACNVKNQRIGVDKNRFHRQTMRTRLPSFAQRKNCRVSRIGSRMR